MTEKIMREWLVAWTLNGTPQHPMLCTLQHMEELMAGHLLTAGRIRCLSDIQAITPVGDGGYQITASLLPDAPQTLPQRLAACQPVTSDFSLPLTEIQRLCRALLADEEFFGTHRLMLHHGEDSLFREDIGRHNAADKVIAAGMAAGWDFSRCTMGSTGRISLEMLCKAAMMGIPVFFSKKYPSDLAVDWAKKMNITLIGSAASSDPQVWGSEQHVQW